MAYDSGQRRIAAFELARSSPGPGCKPNLARATQVLREEYESFRDLNENTLRRFLRDPKFKELIQEAESTLQTARLESDLKREKERAAKAGKSAATLQEELERDEELLQKLRDTLDADLASMKGPQRVKLATELTALIDRRRAFYLPAIGTSEDGKRLVTATSTALFKLLPAGTAAKVVAMIRKLYAKGASK